MERPTSRETKNDSPLHAPLLPDENRRRREREHESEAGGHERERSIENPLVETQKNMFTYFFFTKPLFHTINFQLA